MTINVLKMYLNNYQKMSALKVKGKNLYSAAYKGKTDEILHLWRENGDRLDVEHKDDYGGTPLHWAAANGHGEACRALVSTCRANVDSRNCRESTPLILAAYFNRLQCVEVLLDLGADITIRSDHKKTALDFARARGHAEITALLEAAEAVPMVKSALKV
jgi:ankyrin repeat protein